MNAVMKGKTAATANNTTKERREKHTKEYADGGATF